MDRLSRKQLKTDQVTERAFDVLEWASENRAIVTKYALGVVVLAVLAFGVYIYRQSQSETRERALAEAIRLDEATVGSAGQATNLRFNSDEEKVAAWKKAFGDIASRYSGTQEGAIAHIYIGGAAAEKGDLAEAEKQFKAVLDNGPEEYASLARISLAQVYAGQGKPDEAEKLFREAINKPSATVSKEQATLMLGQFLAAKKPDEARKLIEPLRTARTAISRAAVSALGSLPGAAQPAQIELPIDPVKQGKQ